MYGAKAGANYDGVSIANLPPGIYKGFNLTEVKVDSATKADGTTGKRIITFLFTGPNGQAHQHTEWEILATDNDAEKKADNLVLRIGHILRKFVSPEVVAANVATTWEQLTAWVMATLPQGFQTVSLDLKVLGNVYNGKATSAFPGYLPFVVKSGDPLSFSAKETAANNEYYAFIAAKPDAEGAPSGTPAASAPVDTDF